MLELRAIDVAYGHAQVLHGVSLSLARGEMAFVVGRNGAGKTTLLKTIAGFLAPSRGTIELDGVPVQGVRAEVLARKGVRFVNQDKRVFADLSVRDNMELAAHACGEPLERAVERLVGLYPKFSGFLDKKAGNLSGGQREILLIGRALVGEPRLLLIDEPTEGLAAIVIEDVFRILNSMKHSISSIIVEQNLSVVARLADRVFTMKEGRIDREIDDPARIADSAALEACL
ncbi:MAG: ATP-binding cassette domain-containing protein [Burkholderiaceae bacterium]|nr:ATP-binding cassette domain-containing protein [Burkholderiaceae bacterium]